MRGVMRNVARKHATLLVGTLIVLMTSLPAAGHHAMEYIEMESFGTVRGGEFVFHLHYDYMVDNTCNPREDHWELTPGLSYGVIDKLMLDVHTHFAKFGPDLVVEEERAGYEPQGPSPMLEAMAVSLQYPLTDAWLLDIAVAGTVEIPFSDAERLLGSEDLVYQGVIILGRGFEDHSNVTVNVSYEKEGGEDALSWALGIKRPISENPHGIAAGVEVMGADEDIGDNWSVLPGVYMPLGAPNIILKTGLEFGESDGANTRRANVTLMYLF
ncbi:MAG: hypothetical protein ABIJ00_10740 [Candidatus Eisenbacteria bacterium]